MSIQWIKSLRSSKTRRRRFAVSTLGTTGIAIAVILSLIVVDGARAQTVVVTPANCAVDGGVAASSVSNVCDGSQSTKTVFTADSIVLKVTLSKPAIVTGVNITPGDDDNLYPYRVASATQIQGCTSAGQGCETAGINAFSYYEVSIVGAGLNQTFDASKYGCEILGTGTRCLQFSEITFNTSVTTRTLSFGSVSTLTYNATQTVAATASAGTGSISYSSSDTAKCTVNSSTGVVTATSGTGTCTITASVASDGVYSAATASVDVTLAKANQSSLTLTSTATQKTWDSTSGYVQSISLTTTGGSSGGAVSYSVAPDISTSVSSCSLDSSITPSSISAIGVSTSGITYADCIITATKVGDTNYSDTSKTLAFRFKKKQLELPTVSVEEAKVGSSDGLHIVVTGLDANASHSVVKIEPTNVSYSPAASINPLIVGDNYVTGLSAATTYYLNYDTYSPTNANGAFYTRTQSTPGARRSVTTNAATVAPTITSQPAGATKKTGDSITFSVTATAPSATPNLTYQWRKNGTNISGATSDTYTINSIATTDSATYSVVVSDTQVGGPASATSADATLTVVAPPTITSQPASTTTVAEGGSATFSVTASGTALSYQWKKDGTAISGATSSSLVLNPVGANDGGTYSVDVKSTVNSVTSTATTSSNASLIVVDAPVISTQPANKNSYLSVSNSFSVSATVATGGLISYVWEVSTNGTTWNVISGATSSSYSMTPTQLTENGKQLRVKVTNTRNSVTRTTISSAATLNVYSSFAWLGTLPTSTSSTIGTPFTFNFNSYLTGGIPTISFQVNSSTLPSGLSFDASTGVLSGTPSRGTYQGNYSISVSPVDGDGGVSGLSKSVTISVSKGVYDTPTGLSATATTNTLKSINVTWDALTMAGWIADGGGYRVEMYSASSGGTLLKSKDVTTNQATFTTSDYSSMLDSTTYYFQVQARSSVATDFAISPASARVSTTTLTPSATPTISSNLSSNYYLKSGETSTTLSVVATGAGTLSYQWFNGASAIPGETGPSYTTGANVANGTKFKVQIVNTINGVPSNSVTSTEATFSVVTGTWSIWTRINGTVGTSLSFQQSITGVNSPVTYSLYSGSLPTGVTLSSSGLVSGTPTESVNNLKFSILATDSKGLTWVYSNIPTFISTAVTVSSSVSSLTGTSGSVTFTVSGGSSTGNYSLDISNGTATGCALSPTTSGAGPSLARTVSISSTSGTCIVRAKRIGTSNWADTAWSDPQTITFVRTQTISFSAPAGTVTFGDSPLTLTAATASSGLTVRYTNNSSTICTLGSDLSLTIIKAGTCQIFAIQDGNSEWSSASTSISITIGKKALTVAISLSANSIFAGEATPSVTLLPTGLVIGDALQSATVTYSNKDGTATYNSATAPTSVGTYIVTPSSAALSSGLVGNYNVTYSSAEYSISKNSQIITFTNPGDKVLGSGTFTVAPTTTATGVSVAVTSATTSICTISGSTVTLVTAGTCTLNANQSGNSSYDAATQVSQSFAVTPPVPVIGTQPANFQGYNSTSSASFSVAATVSTGTLSYQWQTSTDSGATWSNVGTSSTNYSQSVSPAGNFAFDGYRYRVVVTNTVNSVTASTTSNEATLSIRLVQTISTTNFPTSRTAYLDEGTISYSAVTGGGSGNPVTFTVTTPSVCTISGTTLTLLTIGSCVVKANQAGLSGTTPFYPALEKTQTVTISAARSAQTITFTQPSSATFGDSAITLAPSSDSGLVVALSSATTSVCTVSGFAVTIVAAGTCTINADQAGDTSFVAATRATQSFTVQKKAVTVTAALSASSISSNATLPTRSFSTTGLVSPNTITGVTYTWKNSSNVTVASMNTATAGTYTLVPSAAVFGSGSTNYDVTYQSASLVIKAPQTITFTQPSSATYGDTPVTLNPSTNASGLSVTLSTTSATVCSVSGFVVTFLGAGNCVLNADQTGDSAYDAATQVQRTLVVAKKNLTVTSTLSSSNISVGGGSATASFTAPALVGSDAITITQTYTDAGSYNSTTQPTAVGSYTLTPSAAVFTSGSADNYNISFVAASLTITAQTQSISFTTISTQTFGVSPITAVATATSGLTVSFTSSTTAVCTVSGLTIAILAVGTCTIAADQAGDSTYEAATTITKSFTVSAMPLTQGAVTATSPAGERMTISATWTAVTNATGYVVKLWSSGTTEWKSFTVDANTTSQTFSPTNTSNLVDNAPYTVSVMATGTGNYTNSTVVHSSLTRTRTVAVVNYNPQQGVGYNPSDFSGTLPSQQRYISGAASPLTVSLNSGNYARVGYDFLGWNTQPNGSGTTYTPGVSTTYGDINLWPLWELTELTVTFNSNYGTATTSTQTFEYGVLENLDANTFTRTGYAFAGWATTSGGSVAQTDGSGMIVTASRTLYAKWTAIDYTVTYVANGSSASVPTETAKNYQDSVTVKAAITRTGYDFQGWSDGTTTYNPSGTLTMPARNITLTALWKIQVYTITYNDASALSGSSSRTSDDYTFGYPAISLPTEGTLAKTGYDFGGWSESLGGTAIVGNYTPTSSKTLYAVWTPLTYTVTYNSNGATGVLEKTSDSYTTGGTAITLPGAGQMTKAGHTFDGWSTTTTGSKISGTYTTSISRTLYARWVAVAYTITYDAAGGSSTPTQASKTIGQTFTLATGPTKTSFEFAGWNDGTTTYDAGYTYVVEDANITLTAEWVEIFWIHYNYNGANETEPADVRKLNGQSFTAGDAVTKYGHTFTGWKSQSNAAIAAGQTFTVNANNFILSAQWTPIDYHVTYASAGGVVLPTETDKNIAQTFTVASAPTRSGYTFNGWNDGALTYGPGATYTVAASNVTLSAQWTAISYDVTYDLALGTSSVPVQAARIVGQTFAVAAMPSRYGYSFVKWTDGTNDFQPAATYTMPANDVTLSAVWQAASLGITYNLNGGSGTAPTETNKEIGNTFTLAGIASWLNHTFLGWFDGTTLFGAGDTYTVSGEPVNLIARWLANIFSANFLTGGASGSTPSVVDREAGQTFSLPSASGLTKSSHSFAGWTDGLQTYQPSDIIAMPSQGTTFTALWTPDPTPPSSGGGSSGPAVPIVTPPSNNAKTMKVTFGTAKSLAKAAEIIGTPVKWKSESPNCKVDAKGVVTTIAVGECSVTAIDKSTLKIASVFNLMVEPRLKISLKSISNLKPTSARLNASVAWPGADFQAKFCVATSATAAECKYLSSISISNETNNSVASKGSVSIARDIQGLTPGTRYFVHAAVLVGDKSYKTAVQLLRTPKKNVVSSKPEVVTLQFPEFTTLLLPAQEKALGAAVLQWQKLGLKTVSIAPAFKSAEYNYFLNDRITQLTDFVKSRYPVVKVVVVGYQYKDGRLFGDVPVGQRGIYITAR